MTYSVMNNTPQAPDKVAPQYFARVMTWLAASFGIAAVGTFFLGPMVPESMIMPLYLLLLGVMLASAFIRKWGEALTIPLAIGVPLILGAVTFRTLEFYLAEGMGGIVVTAAAGTAFIFGGMAIWGWTTKKDLSSWYGPMFFILLGVIGMSLINVFFLQLPTMGFLIAVGVLVVFSIYTVMDIQSLRKAYQDGNTLIHPATRALNLFLNIINIFFSLLRILSPR